MPDESSALPEDVEAAVYEALLERQDSATAITELLEQHPEHSAAIRALSTRVQRGAQVTDAAATDAPPARIGRYRLENELGRGGFGVVFRAQQDAPLERTVALKILAPGLDAATVHARFETERQLLARLTHPGIAQIHDAGTTDEGRPWFAMEFIDGPTITEWAAAEQPPLEALLRVFLGACDAVQHAHQRGVIHRDLKPGNVLVGKVSDQPQATIIDFGIAKVVDEPSEGTSSTIEGAILGTPEYMSPEQARGETADVRSDVFGLGGLLFRLLTGAPPRNPESLAKLRGLDALRRELTTQITVRPSQQAEDTAPARARALRGDLDWICLTALHGDPEQRYASVAELATDLRLHLDGRPISARPPSFGYLLRTTWRRYRLRVLAAGAAALLLIAASLVSTWLWIDAREQRRLAGQRAEELDAAFLRLQQVTDPLRAAELSRRAEEELWPALPASRAAFADWLEQARPLAQRLAEQATAETSSDDRPHVRLERDIEAVEARQQTADELATRHDAAAERWRVARAELQEDPRFAEFSLRPVAGLEPLGKDPDTGLQEFAHLLSGERPERGQDGRLRPQENDALVLVLVPGANARIGAQSQDPAADHYDADAAENEQPVHTVRLDPFLISKWEMTQGQWLRITGGENPSRWHDRIRLGDVFHSLLHPVEQVSWQSAREVLARCDLALPTETAWEYAARAETTDRWLGATSVVELARTENIADRSFGERSPAGTTFEDSADDGYVVHAPIGSFAANRFGLYDVLGNVYEWTDSRAFDYDVVATAGRGERTGERILTSARSQRIFRGGAYNAVGGIGRVSRRSQAPLDARSASVGIRPVRWLDGGTGDANR